LDFLYWVFFRDGLLGAAFVVGFGVTFLIGFGAAFAAGFTAVFA
jgi:hypothetical protein